MTPRRLSSGTSSFPNPVNPLTLCAGAIGDPSPADEAKAPHENLQRRLAVNAARGSRRRTVMAGMGESQIPDPELSEHAQDGQRVHEVM